MVISGWVCISSDSESEAVHPVSGLVYSNLIITGPSYCLLLAEMAGSKSLAVTPCPDHLPTGPEGRILFSVNAGELEQTVSGTSISMRGSPLTSISVESVTGHP